MPVDPVNIGLGLKAIGGILGSRAKKKARKREEKFAEQNRQDAFKRFEDVMKYARDDQARAVAENNALNEDYLRQVRDYDSDIEKSREEGRGIYKSLLDKTMAELGPEGPGDTSANAAMVARTRGRERLEEDAAEAAGLRRAISSQILRPGPSADNIANLLSTRGGRAITRSFEESGNKAATEMSRTGGDIGSVYGNLARQRSDALRDNEIESQLGGIQAAEQMQASRMGRLSPLMAQLSARATAQPSADQEISLERGREQDRGINRFRRASAITSLAPAAMAPIGLRKFQPNQLMRAPNLNMAGAGIPLAMNNIKPDPRATSSGGFSKLLGNFGNYLINRDKEDE